MKFHLFKFYIRTFNTAWLWEISSNIWHATLTKKKKKEEDDILERFQIGLVKKKTVCDKLGKKHVKELENRTLCMTNLGKSTQRT